MWMSVLRKEHNGFNAGTMFAVTRNGIGVVIAYYLDFSYDPPRIDNSRKELCMTPESAREYFTKPTKDLAALMNESVNVSEATYC